MLNEGNEHYSPESTLTNQEQEREEDSFINFSEGKLYWSEAGSSLPKILVRPEEAADRVELIRMGNTVLVSNLSGQEVGEIPGSAELGMTWPSHLRGRKLNEIMEEGRTYQWSGLGTFPPNNPTNKEI